MLSSNTSAVVTLWYITTAEPQAVLSKGPKADRGFGRKLLSMLNPTWPVTPIGQFPLNRSAQASPGEFYIGGYPRLTVIQTVLDDATHLSAIPQRLLKAVPAADIYAYAVNGQSGLGGIAHWRGTSLKRAFVATQNRIFEDYGVPEPFENPLWAKAEPGQSGINLPFHPIELVAAAQEGWLGFRVDETGPEVNVVAYAIDGRPEPTTATPGRSTRPSAKSQFKASSAQIGADSADIDGSVEKYDGDHDDDYDDYEDHSSYAVETYGVNSQSPLTALVETSREVFTTGKSILNKKVAPKISSTLSKTLKRFKR
ncbi:MAG: hypothetical protein Q3972_02245 [Corynebacterium sp.]|nr:hypothetical protein [Corynebacterium sp.]